MDSGGELFVWMGKKSARFLRYAGFKLAEELTEMMPRGCFGGAEDTLIDEIVADSSVEQTVTAHKRLPPQPCPEGAENEVSPTLQFSTFAGKQTAELHCEFLYITIAQGQFMTYVNGPSCYFWLESSV